MKPGANITLAALAGIVVGSLVNVGIINVGPFVIPLPEGADVSTMESLRDSMELFAPANFIPPFLAHALGTLAGAFVAAKLSASHRVKTAIGVSVFFLAGGIAAISMLGGAVVVQRRRSAVGLYPHGLSRS